MRKVGCTYLQRNKYNMSVFETVIRLFAPYVCLECGVEDDRLLCVACVAAIPRLPSRCYQCYVTTKASVICDSCRPHSALQQVIVAVPYQGSAQHIVHALKYERAQSAAKELAECIYEAACSVVPQDALITHVPTATARVRKRGYDHAKLLARHTANMLDQPHTTLLGRIGQAHQVGAGRQKRLLQLEGAFRPIRTERIRGRHIVLVDDVVTTGATLETAARVLLGAGAATVSAVVFAQAERDA